MSTAEGSLDTEASFALTKEHDDRLLSVLEFIGVGIAVTVESESVAAGVASLTDLSEQGLMEGFHMENHIDWTDVFDAGTYGLGRGVGIPKEVLDQVLKSVATQLIGLATGAQTKFDFVALRNAAIEATVDDVVDAGTGLDADDQAVEEGADTALNTGMTTALTGRAQNFEMVVDEALVSTIEDEAIAKIHAESQNQTSKTSGKGKNKLDQQRKRDQAVGKSTPKSDAARSQQSPESQERHSLKAHDKTIKQLDKENKAKKQASSWKKPDAKPKTHASVVASRTKSQAKTGYEGVASAKASQRQSVVSQRQTRMQRWGSQSSTSKWQELKAFVKGVANESARRLVGDAQASMDESIGGLEADVTKLMFFESLSPAEKLQVLESYADAQVASLHRLDSDYESSHGVGRAYLLGEGSSVLAAKAIGLFAVLGTDGDASLEDIESSNLTHGQEFHLGEVDGVHLKVVYRDGLDQKEFVRKVNRLQNAISKGEASITNLNRVTDAERSSLTRQYRKQVIQRINKMYESDAASRQNAISKLRNSDIDHILDLQLGGLNEVSNLKALSYNVNRSLGRQIASQLMSKNTQKMKL